MIRTGPDSSALDFAVFGVGGHGRELDWIARRCLGPASRGAFVVDAAFSPAAGTSPAPMDVETFLSCYPRVPIIIGVGNPDARMTIVSRLNARGAVYGTFVDPSATVAEGTEIDSGAVIAPGAIITVNVVIGAHVHVGAGAILSHDAVIGAGCQLSPGARIAGHVRFGQGVFVGVGATIINGRPEKPLHIGDGAFIAAGACVTCDVAANTSVAGVPAREIARRGK